MPQDGKKARSAVHALFDGESILLLQSSSAFTITQDPNPAQRRSFEFFSANPPTNSNCAPNQCEQAKMGCGEQEIRNNNFQCCRSARKRARQYMLCLMANRFCCCNPVPHLPSRRIRTQLRDAALSCAAQTR